MTSFYSWRLMFLTFWGAPRGDHHTHEHAHESPAVMLVPLGVLGLGAVFAGMIWYNSFFGHSDAVARFFGIPYGEVQVEDHGTAGAEAAAQDKAETGGHGAAEAHADHGVGEKAAHHGTFVGAPGEGAIHIGPDNHVLDDAHAAPTWVKLSPFGAMVFGLGLAWLMYIRRPDLPGRLAAQQRPLYLFLLNKWYFDEINDFLFVRPALGLGRFLWKSGDGTVIDGGINGLAMGVVPWFTRLAGRMQSGYIFTYALFMVLGIGVLITWMTIGGGAR
jgi:NADH-quinone oxidoreductase subunit L